MSGPRGWSTPSLAEAQQVARLMIVKRRIRAPRRDDGGECTGTAQLLPWETKSRAGSMRKKATRFAVLPSPDSISGDWYSFRPHSPAPWPLDHSARANHQPCPATFSSGLPAPISSFDETHFEPCSSHHQDHLEATARGSKRGLHNTVQS